MVAHIELAFVEQEAFCYIVIGLWCSENWCCDPLPFSGYKKDTFLSF